MRRPSPVPISELLLEYQQYVVAYRLRRQLGGALRPAGAQLPLAAYGLARNERQALARQMISRTCPPGTLDRLEHLSDTLLFGFWYNPAQMAEFLRAAIRQGGHPALEQPGAFAELLSPTERLRLGHGGVQQFVRHHHACLALAAFHQHPGALDRVWASIEAESVPLFVDELHLSAAPLGQLGAAEPGGC